MQHAGDTPLEPLTATEFITGLLDLLDGKLPGPNPILLRGVTHGPLETDLVTADVGFVVELALTAQRFAVVVKEDRQ